MILLLIWLLISSLYFIARTLADPPVTNEQIEDIIGYYYHRPDNITNKLVLFPVYLLYGLIPDFIFKNT